MCEFFKVGSLALLGVGTDPEADRFRAWMTKGEFMTEKLARRRLLVMGMAGAAGKLLPVSPLVAAAHSLAEVGREDRKLEQAHVTTARNTATELAVAYATTPDADTRRAARAYAYTLFSLLKPNAASMDDTVRRDLQAVASDAAALAGYGYLDAKQFAEADRWFRCALELARESGDRRLEAYALASRGWIPRSRCRQGPGRAAAAFQAASELHPFLPPSGRAWVFGFLGLETAAFGDDLSSGRFLEEARVAGARVQHEKRGWGLWSTQGELIGWDTTRPEGFTAIRSLRLGRAAEALEIFTGLAMPGTPVSAARRHVEVMEACAALGDLERACAAAHAALDVATVLDLAIVPAEVARAVVTFPSRWQHLEPVRNLHERLRLVA